MSHESDCKVWAHAFLIELLWGGKFHSPQKNTQTFQIPLMLFFLSFKSGVSFLFLFEDKSVNYFAASALAAVNGGALAGWGKTLSASEHLHCETLKGCRTSLPALHLF